MMLTFPSLQTIETSAFTLAGTLIFGIVWALVNVNIRHWAGVTGHDVYLLKLWGLLPEWGRKLLAGWGPLRQLWWLWLSLGLSGGLSIALWLLAPVQMPVEDIAKVTASIQAKLDDMTRQRDAVTRERDDIQTQVATLQKQINTTQHPPSLPAIETTKTPPHYTASEIDTMLGTLGQLRDLLGARQRQPHKDVMRLISSTRQMGLIIPPLPLPSEAAEVADNIENYARKLAEDIGKINELLDRAPLLKTELSSTVGEFQEKILKFTNSLSEMASVLRLASENIKNNTPIGTFISQQTNNLMTRASEYSKWLADSIQKIEAKTREIRGWR
jgi:septal ring factor EnvC (AmiA/AmiB activator)